MAGNVGMLGADYAGYFEVGDAPGLARLLRQCRADQVTPASPDKTVPDNQTLLRHLQHQCQLRVPLFSPDTEQAALLQLVDSLWTP